MRQQDIAHFLAAAREFHAWILVRRTNEASLQYIGQPGFTPKPIDCKAKTADVGDNAGLVVKPSARGSEFVGDRAGRAQTEWIKFAQPLGFLANSNADNRRYRIDGEKGTRPGAVQYRDAETGNQWCYLHGDYDLYDIIPVEEDGTSRANLAVVGKKAGVLHFYGHYFDRVARFVNSRIGVPMIQHAGHLQYDEHLSGDKIDAFGPKGEKIRFPEEYPKIEEWYEKHWPRRKPVGSSWLPGPKT
jgi:hypothetical protein